MLQGQRRMSGETVLLALTFLFGAESKWQGSPARVMVCTCGQASGEQVMLPRACVPFPGEKEKKNEQKPL